MGNNNFLASHAGLGTAGVLLACLLFAWPPACSYLLSVAILVWACHHLRRACDALEHDQIEADGMALPPSEQPELSGLDADSVRSQLGAADRGWLEPAGRGLSDQGSDENVRRQG